MSGFRLGPVKLDGVPFESTRRALMSIEVPKRVRGRLRPRLRVERRIEFDFAGQHHVLELA